MKKAAPAILCALVLSLAAACGGDDAEKLTTTITSNIAEAISVDGGFLDEKAAECAAKKFVDELGAKKLQDAKVVTEDGSYNDNGANVDVATSNAYAEAVLACVDRDEAAKTIKASLTAESTGAAMSSKNARCYVEKLVDTVDVQHLLSSGIINDGGVLNENAASPDEDTAAKSTAALLGCVDYYALEAKERAAQSKGLNTKTYAACLRKKLPEDLLSKFLTAIQAQTAEQNALRNQVNKLTTECAKQATK